MIFERVITVSQVSDKCRCRGALRRSSIGNKMGKNWQKHWSVNKWWGPPLSGCHHWRIFRYVILCGNKCRWPILQTETRGNTSQEWQELALYSSVVVLAGWWMVSPVPAQFLTEAVTIYYNLHSNIMGCHSSAVVSGGGHENGDCSYRGSLQFSNFDIDVHQHLQ